MKNLFLIIAFFAIILPLFSQPGGEQDRQDRLKAIKIAFLTDNLDLTSEEAKGFWPIYEEYEAQMEAFRKAAKLDKAEARIYWDDMTDAQAESLIDDHFKRQEDQLKLQKETTDKMKEVLPTKKVAKFWSSEAKFRAKILRKFSEDNNPVRLAEASAGAVEEDRTVRKKRCLTQTLPRAGDQE